MIIRILGEGQFLLDDALLEKLNAIDNRIVDHVSKGDKAGFAKDLAGLIAAVKDHGKPLDPAEIRPSDLIIPGSDMSIEEAKSVFSGEGLIKG
jgi:hypothetical protein